MVVHDFATFLVHYMCGVIHLILQDIKLCHEVCKGLYFFDKIFQLNFFKFHDFVRNIDDIIPSLTI